MSSEERISASQIRRRLVWGKWVVLSSPSAWVLMHQTPSLNAWRLWPWPAKIKND